MSEKVHVLINGTTHELDQGTRILDYLLSQEIQHPHICYSEILGPVQSCDTCVCEVNGSIVKAWIPRNCYTISLLKLPDKLAGVSLT